MKLYYEICEVSDETSFFVEVKSAFSWIHVDDKIVNLFKDKCVSVTWINATSYVLFQSMNL
ncbi:hypothetical protein SFRURICE_011946 [Spodoptera frugiperda]|nr:hypothetical protein SFRURICE_011946 [Spodoptera frugiperda]